MKLYRAILLDAFGTVVEITDRRTPYRKLFTRMGIPLKDGIHAALTINGDILEVLARFGFTGTPALDEFRAEVAIEAASIRPYPDVLPALRRLRDNGYRLWIVSNLAKPYGEPVRRLFLDLVEGYTFSYQCGFAKPCAEIFDDACGKLGVVPKESIMVGDKPNNDVSGAMAVGLDAVLVKRQDEENGQYNFIRSLSELTDYLLY